MPLTPQQQEGVDFLLNNNLRVIEADAAGAGKTYPILSAILERKEIATPALIISIGVGVPVWKNELLKWFDLPSIVYTGTPKQREKLREKFKEVNPLFVITKSPMLKELMDTMGVNFFKTLVLDEYHMYGFLNRKSLIYKQVKHLATIIPHIIPSTGTPIRRNPSQYFTALSVVHPYPTEELPYSFTSFWKFAYEYCIVNKEQFGYVIEEFPLNRQKLAEMLRHFLIRRTIDKELPLKLRQAIPYEMSTIQRKAYNQLVDDMILQREGLNPLLTPNQMTRILRCRQLLVCPKILGIDDIGGGLEALIELVQLELSHDNPVLVFTPFTEAIPFIKEELEKIKDLYIYIIQGGMDIDYYEKVQYNFQNNSSKNKVLICSIKSAASMTLTKASLTISLGYEYDATDNTQAENRSWRKTQTNEVRCLYLLCENTPDQDIIDILNNKQLSIDVSTTPYSYYQKLLATTSKV